MIGSQINEGDTSVAGLALPIMAGVLALQVRLRLASYCTIHISRVKYYVTFNNNSGYNVFKFDLLEKRSFARLKKHVCLMALYEYIPSADGSIDTWAGSGQTTAARAWKSAHHV